MIVSFFTSSPSVIGKQRGSAPRCFYHRRITKLGLLRTEHRLATDTKVDTENSDQGPLWILILEVLTEGGGEIDAVAQLEFADRRGARSIFACPSPLDVICGNRKVAVC